MRKLKIGQNGDEISEAGLGCMGMSGGYGSADDAESIATIHAALDAGVTLIDTGDFYGMGHNEMLIGEALKGGKRLCAGPPHCIRLRPYRLNIHCSVAALKLQFCRPCAN
jgi:Aldo/keto reductase family